MIGIWKLCSEAVLEVSWVAVWSEVGPKIGIIEDCFPIADTVLCEVTSGIEERRGEDKFSSVRSLNDRSSQQI